jgi:ankyrin repeat protein
MIVSEVFMLQAGDTALHDAAVRGRVEAAKALVDCGAAVDIRNKV